MRRLQIYLLCGLLAAMMLQSCGDVRHKTNWTVTLQNKDKNPYGSYLAYQSLKYNFPNAEVEVKEKWFKYSSISSTAIHGDKSLFILAGLNLYLSDTELEKLFEYAAAGNEVLIFASNIDSKIENKLGFNKVPYSSYRAYEEIPLNKYNDGTENNAILNLPNEATKQYGYYGRFIRGYFVKKTESTETTNDDADEEAYDTSILAAAVPDTLGTTEDRPNILRYAVGEGHITLHAAPLVLSNYFLLQPGNHKYLEAIWQSLPGDIKHIYWNEYYKRTTDKSDFGVLWQYPATRNALILALVGLLLYVLFESKRRQSIVPVIPPLENSSVSFVETVGRLYYNKGDHSNLADKMIQHFLEWVRTHYYLNTNYLNDDFIRQLVNKSGEPEPMVRNLLEMIHEIRNGYKMDEAYLYQLYNSIEQFYKNKA